MRPSGRSKLMWYYTAVTSQCPKTIYSGISVYKGEKEEFSEERVCRGIFNNLLIFRKKVFVILIIENVV